MPSRTNNNALATFAGARNVANAAATIAAAQESAKIMRSVAGELAQNIRNARQARGSKPQAKSAADRKMGGGKPGQTISPPVSQGYFLGANSYSQMGQTKFKEVVRGQSILGAVKSGASSSALLAVYNLMPTLLADRMATVAGTYDKYVYRNVCAVYTPTCSTATNGSVMMYFERDVMDTPANPVNLQQFMSAENAALGPVYSKVSTLMKRDTEEKRTYFTSVGSTIEPHELCQFKLVVGGTGMTANTPLGLITLHYELELIAPVFSPAEVSFAFAAYNQYTTAAGNVSYTGVSGATNATPFGLPAATLGNAPVWEVVVIDTNSVSVNSGITLGASGPALTLRCGQTYYLSNALDTSSTTNVNWTLHATYQSALVKGQAYVYNSNVGVSNAFSAPVSVLYRAIGSQVAAATL